MTSLRLIVVDDERDYADTVVGVAQSCGYDAHTATDPAALDALLEAAPLPAVAVVDISMPEMDGIDVLKRLKARAPRCAVVLHSGKDEQIIRTVRQIGLDLGLNMAGYCAKPARAAALRAALEGLLHNGQEICEDMLRRSFDNGDYAVSYQPKVSLQSGIVTGYEALLRLTHPVAGAIPPTDFIPVAEDSGLIHDLTHFVIADAAGRLRRWTQEGRDMSVAINLSPLVLEDPDLPLLVNASCRGAGVEPDRIVFEITEGVSLDRIEGAVENLTRLRMAGFRLSLDDFGTGYSSLVQLKRMPFSEIKVDRAFVSACPRDGEAAVIVRAIIGLAHSLGLTAVAEGVETRGCAAFLQELACDQAQGFLYGRPQFDPDPSWRPQVAA